MWSEEKIKDYLKKNLKEKRFNHSIGVSKTAESLAKKYGEDSDKARVAGLLHDIAKNMKDEEIVSTVENVGIEIDYVFKSNPNLMHGLAGAIICRNVVGVTDKDILGAVEFHTTGKANMSMLEKIICLADYIEPSRNFEGVDDLRNTAQESIDKALLMALDGTIKFVLEKKQLLHYKTVEARNYLILNK